MSDVQNASAALTFTNESEKSDATAVTRNGPDDAASEDAAMLTENQLVAAVLILVVLGLVVVLAGCQMPLRT